MNYKLFKWPIVGLLCTLSELFKREVFYTWCAITTTWLFAVCSWWWFACTEFVVFLDVMLFILVMCCTY